MNQIIKPRVRLVIIKNNKLLTTFNSKENFYFYIGGKMEFGETIVDACTREIKEECGDNVKFYFKKILYIRDFIKKATNEHSIEFYVYGNIESDSDFEGRIDPEYPESHTPRWVDLQNIPKNLLPKELKPILLRDKKYGFKRQGIYLGEIN